MFKTYGTSSHKIKVHQDGTAIENVTVHFRQTNSETCPRVVTSTIKKGIVIMMENAWIIPLFPLLSFLILLFFGKRLKEASAYVGILFTLLLLSIHCWCCLTGFLDQPIRHKPFGLQ